MHFAVGTFWAGGGIRLWAEAVGGSFARAVVRVVWLTCDLWVWCGRVLFAANLLGGCGGLCWIVRYLAVGDGLRREVHLQSKQPDFAASRQLIARSTIVRRSFGRLSGVTCVRAPRPSLLAAARHTRYLVDPASSHMLVSKTKPCTSECEHFAL